MTAQVPDRLVNDHPRVKFRRLHLYGIIQGDVRSNHGWGERYRFAKPPDPPKDRRTCTALWRGYVATFRLDAHGELELVSYRYPLASSKSTTQAVHEKLSGDFWLVLKRNFFGPRTYVPFKDGKIIEDASTWFTESPRNRTTSRASEQPEQADEP